MAATQGTHRVTHLI